MQTDTGCRNLTINDTQINKHYVKNMESPDFVVILPEPLPCDGCLSAALFFYYRDASPETRNIMEEPNGIQKSPYPTTTQSRPIKKIESVYDPLGEKEPAVTTNNKKQKTVPYFHVTDPAPNPVQKEKDPTFVPKDPTFVPKGTTKITFQIALSVVKNKNQIHYAYCIRLGIGEYSMYSSEFQLHSHQKQIKNGPSYMPAVKVRKTESKQMENMAREIEWLKEMNRTLITRVDNFDQLKETNDMLMTHVSTCQQTITGLMERVQNVETYAYTQGMLLQLARKFEGCIFYTQKSTAPLATAFAQLGIHVEHGKTTAKITHVVVDPRELTPEIVKKAIAYGMCIVDASKLAPEKLGAQLFSLDSCIIDPVARLSKRRVFVEKKYDSEKLRAVLLECNAARVDDVSDAEFVVDTKAAFGKMFVY